MSVIVKGMEMPNACCHCPCSDSAGCAVTGRVMTTEEMAGQLGDIDDCPLRPLPEKHGDLVDISQEVNIEYFDDMNQEWSLKAGTVAEALSVCEEFPETIVEAEA